MSLKIPRKPTGSHPLAQCLREIIDCLHKLQPMPGKDTFTDVTTRGTRRSAKPQSGGGGTTESGPARYA